MVLIESTDKPLVIDADGLNALAARPSCSPGCDRPVILTPHPGEFARLVGTNIADVQADRIERARSAWPRCSEPLVVVLKGAGRRDRRTARITSTRPGTPAWRPEAPATS